MLRWREQPGVEKSTMPRVVGLGHLGIFVREIEQTRTAALV
jgi:hypothetical protein